MSIITRLNKAEKRIVDLYNKLKQITFEQVNADWNATSGPAELLNKPDLSLKADLVGGTVPPSQLPSYVDDILEFADLASLPVTGETGKIYVTLDDNKLYRWSGSIYVEVSAGSGGSIRKEAAFQLRFTTSGVLEISFTFINTTNSTEFNITKTSVGRYTFQPNNATGGKGFYEASIAVGALATGTNATITIQLLSNGPAGGIYLYIRNSATGDLVDPGVLVGQQVNGLLRYTDYSI